MKKIVFWIIEDSLLIQEVYMEVLNMSLEEYEKVYEMFQSNTQVLEILSKQDLIQPNVIILDGELLDGDSDKLIEPLKNKFDSSSLVIITGYDKFASRNKTKADFVFIKPFITDDLIEKIKLNL